MNYDKYSFNITPYCHEKNICPTEYEAEFMQWLVGVCQNDKLTFERRSDNYISAFCGLTDFLRFKLTERTMWFSLYIPFPIRNEYIDGPLFPDQDKKKDRNHWKVKFKSYADLKPYEEVIRLSCVEQEVS